MSYSLIKKYNWTYFAEKILNALTGSKNTYMANIAAGETEMLPIAFRSISIMNTHATNTIKVQNSTQNIILPALTTVTFDAVQGSLYSGDITIITGFGTAIVAGTY